MQPSVGGGALPVRSICPPWIYPSSSSELYLHTSAELVSAKHSRAVLAVNNPLTGTGCGLPWSLCAGCHGEAFPHGEEPWGFLFVRSCAYPVPWGCGQVIPTVTVQSIKTIQCLKPPFALSCVKGSCAGPTERARGCPKCL